MNYYDEVKNYVKKVEIGNAIRESNANRELVECYWNVGRLLVEAQSGKDKAKYGDELIKEWAEKLTNEYGKDYSYENLFKFCKFYLGYPVLGSVPPILDWTNICKIFPIQDENKRNYYINPCKEHNLPKRELENEIKNYVKKVEIGNAIREASANYEILDAYWNIGKIIVEAQGGKEKDKLLKEWAEKLSKEYGKGYDYSNMRKFRQFYLAFPNFAPVGQNLNWTIVKTVLPIKDENKRNYYINLYLQNNLSQRQLEKEIKNNSYEKVLNKPVKKDIIAPKVTTLSVVMILRILLC